MVLTLIAVASLLAWLYLLLFHGGFWRGDQWLPAAAPAALPSGAPWPAVVAVVPARDEAAVIGRTIAAHAATSYPGRFKTILVDDASTDGTAEAARAAAAGAGRPDRLTVTQAPPLPSGWSGKLHAVQHGLDVAKETMPEAAYVLLTDADIALAPDTLTKLVAKAEGEGRALVSLMARLDDRGFWAGLLIPAFVFFFQKLYPFPRVNDPDDPMAGAAGGCMLVARDVLDAAGGMRPIGGALIDDCAVARLVQGPTVPRRPIWVGLTRDVVSLRDNRAFSGIWNMVARTAYTQLGYSPLLLAGTVAGMALVYLAGPLLALTLALHGNLAAATIGMGTWFLMPVLYTPTLKLYDRPALEGLGLPLAGLLYTGMTLDSALRHWQGRGGQWKGRRYDARALTGGGAPSDPETD